MHERNIRIHRVIFVLKEQIIKQQIFRDARQFNSLP